MTSLEGRSQPVYKHDRGRGGVARQPHMALVVDDVAGEDEAQVAHVHDAGVAVSVTPTGMIAAVVPPITIPVLSSGCGPTGSSVNWSGKKSTHTRRYPSEICSSIPEMDSGNATGLACGKPPGFPSVRGNGRRGGWVM